MEHNPLSVISLLNKLESSLFRRLYPPSSEEAAPPAGFYWTFFPSQGNHLFIIVLLCFLLCCHKWRHFLCQPASVICFASAAWVILIYLHIHTAQMIQA